MSMQIQPFSFNNLCTGEPKRADLCLQKSLVPFSPLKDSVSFSGRQKDLLELPREEIFEKISQSINNENLLGEGNEARVYKIAGTNYAFRHARIPDDRTNFTDYKKNLSFDINTDDKINHVVAKLGEDSAILRYLPGENCFVYNDKKELCNLPTDSYYNLYKQICFAKDNEMIFDCCETNIIYNPKDKSLTAIDFYKQDYGFPENVKPLSFIFSAIAPDKPLADNTLYKNLLGSLVNVILKEFEPGVKPAQNLGEIDINQLFRNFESYYKDEMPPQYEILRSKLITLQCLKLQDMLGQDVKNEINANIKVAKSIVNQILKKDNNSFLNHLKLGDFNYL